MISVKIQFKNFKQQPQCLKDLTFVTNNLSTQQHNVNKKKLKYNKVLAIKEKRLGPAERVWLS